MRHRYVLGLIALTMAVSPRASLRAQTAPERPYLVLRAGPQESVTSLAVSRDGALVATGSFDGRVRIYDARAGTLRTAIGSDPSRGVRSLAFTPDGKAVIAAGLEMDKTVKVWDLRTGALLKELAGHEAPGTLYADVNGVAVSPDGRRVASAARDGLVLVWDLETGKMTRRLAGHKEPAIAVAFSPDGRTLASGGSDRTVRLWDPETGRPIRVLEGHGDAVCAVAFSPDGKMLASGSTDWGHHRGHNPARFDGRDPGSHCEWKLWDAARGECTRTVAESGRLSSLAFAPDGLSLACGAGHDVRLYDLRGEAPGRVVTSHDEAVTALAFAPDGKAVYSGSHDRTARRVDAATGREAWRLPGYWEQVSSVAISRDGALIAAGSGDLRFAERKLRPGARGLGPGALRVWEARTGRLLRRLGDPAEQVTAVAFAPGGHRVAAGVAGPGGTAVVRVWDARTGAAAWSRDDHAADVMAVAYSPDGGMLASGDAAGRIVLRDPEAGAVLRTLDGHGGGLASIAFSADGTIIAGGSDDEGARLWEARTGRLIRTVRPSGSRGIAALFGAAPRTITSVALSPDGHTLATCGTGISSSFDDRPIRVWDARTGELAREFSRPQSRGRFVALSPDGTILAANGLGKAIALWDPRTGQLLRELVGHPHPPQSAAFSPDGRVLVSGADYRTVMVWEGATGRLLATLSTFSESRPGTTSDDWLAATPEGSYDGSPGIDRFLAWRVGRDQRTPGPEGMRLHRPDRLESALGAIVQKPASP